MTGENHDPFLRVLQGLLRPLVRVLIRRGVTAPALYRLLKQTYVEVADAEFGLEPGSRPTDSRVSLLTGVHRKDVREMRAGEGSGWEAARGKAAVFATVIGQWATRADWRGPDGAPRVLDRAEFEALVRAVNRDVRPRTVLDELLRQGLVEEEGATLRLAQTAVSGPGSDEHKVIFFAANVGDHLAAAAENLAAETPPFLERAVFYNRLSPTSVDKVEARARVLSQAVLEELNEESSALQSGDMDDDAGTERYRFGVYFYREDAAPPKDTEGRE